MLDWEGSGGQGRRPWRPAGWTQIPAWPLSSCVTLAKSVTQHLQPLLSPIYKLATIILLASAGYSKDEVN